MISSSLVINRLQSYSTNLQAFVAFPLRGRMRDFAMPVGVDHPLMAAYYQRAEERELKRMTNEDDQTRFYTTNESTEANWRTYYGRRSRPTATTPTASEASEPSPTKPRVR